MLKLLIIDDEKIIRETITQIIDWKSLGIELIGSADNGVDALNIILDEYPDIVMTDIKMPGFSGLELISKISRINKDTRFIILTGYGKFEYAKQAMQYGVKHYLLKPCNVQQITACINEIKSEIRNKNLMIEERFHEMHPALESSIFHNLISDGLRISNSEEFTYCFKIYENYFDFYHVPYELIHVYYLDEKYLDSVIINSKLYQNTINYSNNIYYIYVKNTLLYFYKSQGKTTQYATDFRQYLLKNNKSDFVNTIDIAIEYYDSFSDLLIYIFSKIRRYDTVYFGLDSPLSKVNNEPILYSHCEQLLGQLLENSGSNQYVQQFSDIINNITDPAFLRKIVFLTILKSYNQDSITNAVWMDEFVKNFDACPSIEAQKELLKNELSRFTQNTNKLKDNNSISSQIKAYVASHIQDTSLSLKWICENILFMNVDYVSKKFLRETGEKFSHYLATIRIARAKELLLKYGNTITLNEIAEAIGCGNNPQYFCQLFKRVTSMTPSNYLKSVNNTE